MTPAIIAELVALGLKANQLRASMGDHYVPRFHLAAFLATEGPARVQNELWKVDLCHRSVRRAAPRRVAQRRSFYSTDQQVAGIGPLEKFYKSVEDRAAKAIARLQEPKPLSGAFEKQTIAMFAALQVSRTPLGHQFMLERTKTEVVTDVLKSEQLRAHFAAMGPEKKAAAAADLRSFVEQLTVPRDLVLRNSVTRPINHLYPLLEKARWHIQEASGDDFITSDHPSVLLRQPALDLDVVVAENRMHLLLAISPRRMLVACLANDQCSEPSMHPIAPDVANRLVMVTAGRELYLRSEVQARASLPIALDVRARIGPMWAVT